MVYVYAKQSEINYYVGKKLSVQEIEDTLINIGMDLKGISEEKDPELKIEITAEKLDLISTVGISRAIKFYLGLVKEVPKYELTKSNLEINVNKNVIETRPKIVAAILKNVPMSQKFLDEMIKIQEKIHDSFGRGRKKAAIGIYPLDKISFPISYSSEDPNTIVFKPLEHDTELNGFEILNQHDTGKKFAHLLKDLKSFPVLRDNKNKVLSMPPIINSHEMGRVEIIHKDLFVEVTGYNENHLDNILKVLITTFIEMGASAQSIKINYSNDVSYELNLDNSFETISLEDTNKLIGVKIKSDDVEKLLSKMMFGLKSIRGDKLEVEIPVFKSDIWFDVDITDDLARAYGYNNIIPKFPNISTVGNKLEISDFKDKISNQLVSMGFLELYTYMLSSTKLHFDNLNLDYKEENFIKLIDSTDQGINMIRTMILPDNLESLRINRKNKYPQKIFENGWTIQSDNSKDTKARNEAHLSVSIAGPQVNYTEIKTIIDTLAKLNNFKFVFKEVSLPYLIEGRGAEVYFNDKKVGFIGELSPNILNNFSLLVPVISFEINLDLIFSLLN